MSTVPRWLISRGTEKSWVSTASRIVASYHQYIDNRRIWPEMFDADDCFSIFITKPEPKIREFAVTMLEAAFPGFDVHSIEWVSPARKVIHETPTLS